VEKQEKEKHIVLLAACPQHFQLEQLLDSMDFGSAHAMREAAV
jgi:hypothetical protein